MYPTKQPKSLRKLLREATVSPKPSVPPKRYRLSPAQQLTPTRQKVVVQAPRQTRLDPLVYAPSLLDATGGLLTSYDDRLNLGINPDAFTVADYWSAKGFVTTTPMQLYHVDLSMLASHNYVQENTDVPTKTVPAGSVLEYDELNYQVTSDQRVIVTDVEGDQLVVSWHNLQNYSTPIRSRAATQPASKVKRDMSIWAEAFLVKAIELTGLIKPIDVQATAEASGIGAHPVMAEQIMESLTNLGYVNNGYVTVAGAEKIAMNPRPAGSYGALYPTTYSNLTRAAMMAVQQPVKRDDPSQMGQIGQRIEVQVPLHGAVYDNPNIEGNSLDKTLQIGDMGTVTDVEYDGDYILYTVQLDQGGYMSFSEYEVADGMVAWRSRHPARKVVKRTAPPPNVQSVLVQLHNGSSYVTFDWGNPYDLGAQVADMLVMNAEEAGNWIGANPDDYFDWAINMGWIDEDGNEL